MRGKNRKTIASYLKLPQFTTMNVIDGQASLVITYSSLIFYSLTIDNILNIIILLILAGVSIATLTGENGLLTQTEDVKEKNKQAAEEEKVKLAIMGSWRTDGSLDLVSLKENLNKEGITSYETEATVFPLRLKVNGTDKKITENGNIEDYINIAEYVSVGDYVDYEPTKTDLNKTQSVEESKLTYTSPTGTIPTEDTGKITHGNGYQSAEEATEDKPAGGQTFTAKANDGTATGLKWRVLSISDDRVEIISEVPVLKDQTNQDSGNFVLQGGIGYLYAEQELNEICKIYGYGYGADITARATYTIGGPRDTEFQQVKTIEEPSGARSITIEDLNKKAGIYEDATDGIMKYSDGTVIDSWYGDETSPGSPVYYPTLISNNTEFPGNSKSRTTKFRNNTYPLGKTNITDAITQEMLFNGEYWLASRAIRALYSYAYLGVRDVVGNSVKKSDLTYTGYYNITNDVGTNPVRPVVTLKSDVIDINIDYAKEGKWKLK